MKNILFVLLGLLIGIIIMANLYDILKDYDKAPGTAYHPGAGLAYTLSTDIDTNLLKAYDILEARKELAKKTNLPLEEIPDDPRGFWKSTGDWIGRQFSSRFGGEETLRRAITGLASSEGIYDSKNNKINLSENDINILAKIFNNSSASMGGWNALGLADTPSIPRLTHLNGKDPLFATDEEKIDLPFTLLNLYKSDNRFKGLVDNGDYEEINRYLQGYFTRKNNTQNPKEEQAVQPQELEGNKEAFNNWEKYAYGPNSALAQVPSLNSIAKQIYKDDAILDEQLMVSRLQRDLKKQLAERQAKEAEEARKKAEYDAWVESLKPKRSAEAEEMRRRIDESLGFY